MNHNTLSRAYAGVMLLCLLALASGCQTSIDAKEATGANADANGLRYFLPTPYLVIEEAADHKWNARLELGVDRSREFYVQPKAVLAKGNAIISFNEDGTLKSFKLDANSTAVPSSVVAAANDVELKRLELEKAALDAAQKKRDDAAQKKKDEKAAGGGALVKVAGSRAFAIYRVKGDEVVGIAARPARDFVQGHISLIAAGGVLPDVLPISTDPPSLKVNLSQDETSFVIKLDARDLTDADKAKLHFFTSVNPITEKHIAADKLTARNGVIIVAEDLMKDVIRVTLAQ